MKSVGIFIAGIVSGICTTLIVLVFSIAVDISYWVFADCRYLIFALPICGAATFGLYKLCKVPFSIGTLDAIDGVDANMPPSPMLAPSIFVGTCFTVLGGGSVGKEAAALQIGAAVAALTKRRTGIDEYWVLRLFAASGMSAALSALFGTPLAASFFVLELFRKCESGFLGAVTVLASAYTARAISWILSADTLSFAIEAPELNLSFAYFTVTLLACSMASGILFCILIKKGRSFVTRLKLHPIWPLVVGGIVYVGIIVSTHGWIYTGTGMLQVKDAFDGHVYPPFFLEKLLLTAMLLISGFKGGEIMPVVSIGATMGCAIGMHFGIPPSFASSLGMVLFFAACTNCPISSIMLGLESVGFGIAPFAIGASLITYLATCRFSLYMNCGPLKKMLKPIIGARWYRGYQQRKT